MGVDSHAARYIGCSLLYFPLLISLLPYAKQLEIYLRDIYIHRTPRNHWAPSVEALPRRKYAGFFIVITLTAGPAFLLTYAAEDSTKGMWLQWLILLAFLSLPTLAAIFRPPSKRAFDLGDIIIILLILIPLEVSQYTSFVPVEKIETFYNWPNIYTSRLAASVICLFIFTILRPLEDVNLDVWMMKREHIPRVIVAIIAFIIIGWPVASASGFIHPQNDVDGWEKGFGMFVAMFFIDGLIYELMYRACLQNLLHANIRQRKTENHFFCPSPSGARSYSNFTDDESIERERRFSDASQDLIMDTNDGTVLIGNKPNYIESQVSFVLRRRDEKGIAIHPTTCQKIWRWFSVGSIANFLVIICSSIFFAFAATDYGEGTDSGDVMRYWVILWWMGMCSGWLWFHTKHVVWCALFYTIFMYIGQTVLGVTCHENQGLCSS